MAPLLPVPMCILHYQCSLTMSGLANAPYATKQQCHQRCWHPYAHPPIRFQSAQIVRYVIKQKGLQGCKPECLLNCLIDIVVVSTKARTNSRIGQGTGHNGMRKTKCLRFFKNSQHSLGSVNVCNNVIPVLKGQLCIQTTVVLTQQVGWGTNETKIVQLHLKSVCIWHEFADHRGSHKRGTIVVVPCRLRPMVEFHQKVLCQLVTVSLSKQTCR